jgi:heme exporter protein A
MIVAAEELSFGYYRPLFQNLSFNVLPGQLLQIHGANGAGKSSLLKVLLGLLAPQTGRVCWGEGQLNQVEYLCAEAGGHLPKLSATDNLLFWSSLKLAPAPPAAAIAAELAYWGFRNPYVCQHLPVEKFSTGMKKRLSLARLRLNGSRLWLLDEPLAGLDTAGVQLVQECLHTHLATQGAAVLISHEPIQLNAGVELQHLHLAPFA